MQQYNVPEKVFVIERLREIRYQDRLARRPARRFVFRKGDIEYRIGYYVAGRIGKMRGRWAWGQFCPLISGDPVNAGS